MKKNIFSLIAIAVIGTSACMAKATPKSVYNPKPRMERMVSRPTTTTVTTTTMKPNGTKVVTTTTTKTVKVAPPKPARHKVTHSHKHVRGTCKDCAKLTKPLTRK